jgi:hypothetical protein
VDAYLSGKDASDLVQHWAASRLRSYQEDAWILDALRGEVVTLRAECAKRDGNAAALAASLRHVVEENARLRQRCGELEAAQAAGARAAALDVAALQPCASCGALPGVHVGLAQGGGAPGPQRAPAATAGAGEAVSGPSAAEGMGHMQMHMNFD